METYSPTMNCDEQAVALRGWRHVAQDAALGTLDRRLLDLLPGAVYFCDKDGVLVQWNRRAVELWGREPTPGDRAERFCGSYKLYRMDESFMAHCDCPVADVLRSGQPKYNVEAILERPDGTRRFILANIEPIRDPSGEVIGAVNIIQDITDRKQAEDSLRQSEQRFRLLLDNLPAAGYTCDSQGLITYFNRRAVELWGREPKLHDPVDRYCGSHKLFSASGSPIIHQECWMALALRNKKEYNGQEIVVERPDGSRRSALAHANPFHDELGNVIGAVNVLTDITHQKKVEIALRDSEAQLRLVMDHAPVYLARCGKDGRFRFVNRGYAEHFGRQPEDFIGKPIAEMLGQTLYDSIRPHIDAVLAGQSVEFEMEIPYRGRTRYMRVAYEPEHDAFGQVDSWIAVVTDLTERRRAEEELREADRRKDNFLATLAHELRNPLAPIRNALEILKMPSVDASTTHHTREVMERQVHHLVRLVDDLLDVSRVMLGKIELRKRTVELTSIIANAVEIAQPVIDAHEHTLETSLPDESLVLDADPVRLAQVVGNLLTNAAKYTEAHGRIWLSAQRAGDQVVLRVRDNGIGLSSSMLSHIFKLFVQVDHTAMRSQGGLGIGLTLSKNLVELHHGTIEAHSAGLGKGSEFVVRFPLSNSQVEKAVIDSNACSHAKTSRQRLLIVDDNEDAANTLATMLQLQGHELQIAHDGSSALELAKHFQPDVVFLDIGMPGMDGYEVARRLRKAKGLENVVLAALTGWGQKEDRRLAAEAGFDHHLTKPPELSELTELLIKVTQQKQQQGIARRFLVVEDNVGAAKILSLLIGKTGPHEVRLAHDGAAALELAQQFHPDIILLDIGLPKMDGYTVARRIRHGGASPQILLVALTGYGQPEAHERSKEAGFDVHITKPVGIDGIRQLLCHPKLGSSAAMSETALFVVH